ncbi:cell wall elongation regulator TseB-like domain-containing protein [Niallia circulans]|uniref:cell wall elongation regulator TseB-like domain-containing protein n=1 Tax=Niallia circulans TaxID=1397 RepID=UPI00352DBDE9
MKKWIWIIVVVVLIGLAVSINTYVQAMKPVKSAREVAENIAKKEADLKEVDSFQLYNGKEAYYILEGKNDDNKDIIVWINEKSHKVTEKLKKDGLTKQEALNILLSKQTPEKVNHVCLGMYDGIPVWEIYSHTDKDSINYYWIDFETGEILLTIENY